MSRLFLDHGTRVDVSRTTFLVSKCLEIGAEVSQNVLKPKYLVAEVSGNQLSTINNLSISEVELLFFSGHTTVHGRCPVKAFHTLVRFVPHT